MKKIASLFSIVILLLCLCACSKDKTSATNNSTAPNNGTYVFKGITYTAKSVTRFNESLSVQNYSGTIVPPTNSNVVFGFATFPTASGTYQIVPGGNPPTAPGQMTILFGGSDYSYNYYGAPSVTGTAAISVDSLGKVTVNISNAVTLVGQGAAYDSATVTASVHQ